MKTILLTILLLLSYANVTQAGWNLRMRYVGTTNTPNLDVRWHGSTDYFGYQNWNVPGGADTYVPNETKEILGISDSTLPPGGNTFVVQWSIAGAGVWNTASASVLMTPGADSGYMEWTLGGAPSPVGTYSFTNNTARPITFEYKDANGSQTVTVEPGTTLNVSSTNAFTLGVIDAFVDGVGEFTKLKYTTNIVASYSGGTPFSGTFGAPPTYNSPTSTNRPVFVDPATDEQRFANAVVNETRNAKDQAARDSAAILAELKKQSEKNLATNRNNASASETNSGFGGMQSTAQTVSNILSGKITEAGDDLVTKYDTFLAVPTVGALGISVPMGAFTVDVNPFGHAGFSAFAGIVRTIIILFIKFKLLQYLFKLWRECLWRIATSTAAATTSGWLQAAVLSIPQLFSSLGGAGLRYAVLGGIVTLNYAVFSGWIIFAGTGFDLTYVYSSLGPTGQIGFGWFLQFMPLDHALTAFRAFIGSCIGMMAITLGGMSVNDVLGKA